MKDMIRSMAAGIGFGALFSVFAGLMGFPIERFFLWLIPLFSGILSAFGALVAGFTCKVLRLKGLRNEIVVNMIGFGSAAIVNMLIVLLMMASLGVAPLHRNVIIALFFGLAFGGVYGIYAYRMNRLNEQMAFLKTLSEKNRQLQEATRTIAITQERNRISRELHDSISQGLHGIMFSLHSLHSEIKEPSPQVDRILSHMEATTKSTLDELRTMIEELKPSVLVEQGLEKSLSVLLEMYSQRQQIPVAVNINIPGVIPAETELAVYRISQEAIANIEKHAEPGNVRMDLKLEETQLTLTISDDGCGFDLSEASEGSGLDNMKRRAEEVNGSLSIESKRGEGTAVRAVFDL